MANRREFVLGLGAAFFWASRTQTASAQDGEESQPRVHEPTEIAWIVASLSSLGRTSGGVIRRDTSYFDAINLWFQRVIDHPVLGALGSEFNLPRFVGNAADYSFDLRGRLIRSSGAVALWDDAAGDLFTRHRAAVEDFSRRGNARGFLKTQAATLAAAHNALHEAVDIRDIGSWLEAQFTERPATVRVFVSPLTDGWNWTNLGGLEPRIWVPAPKTGAINDIVQRFIIVASVFTEFDHIYVNQVTKQHIAAVESVFAKENKWANEDAWDNYGSAELVFNEYMTWGVFLAYAQERLSSSDYDALAARIVRFMETKRGFLRFGAFVSIVGNVRRERTNRLQELFPEIIARAGVLGADV